MWNSVLKLWRSASARTRPQLPRRRSTRLTLEHLEDRTTPSTFNAATVSDLIADINAANKAGGASTIALTAPTSSPYIPTVVHNVTCGGLDGGSGGHGLPVTAANAKKIIPLESIVVTKDISAQGTNLGLGEGGGLYIGAALIRLPRRLP
jgi:hypothetical protein